MARKHQLSKSETQAIASRFKSNALHQQLQEIVDLWNYKADGFSLTTEEVFYHVIRSLDEIWSMSNPSERITYCKRLQVRLHNHLAEQVETERKDLERAVALVVGAVIQSLFVVDSFMFIDEIVILKASTPMRNELNEALRGWITGAHAKELHNWLAAYRHSPQCISAEIEDLVHSIRSIITEHINLATPMDLSKLDTSHMTHLTIVGDNATNIEHVEHYHEASKRAKPQSTNPATFEEKKEAILEYVDKLSDMLAGNWTDCYGELWQSIIEIPTVSASIYDPGKQQGMEPGKEFNRNLTARIIRMMGKEGAFGPRYVAQHLAEKLEGNKDHSVKAQLGYRLDDVKMEEDVMTKIREFIPKSKL